MNETAGNIFVSGTATKSMGIRVGNANATNMSNKSTITIDSTAGDNMSVYSATAAFENEGKTNVNGNKNIGMYFTGTTGTNKNNGTITVAGTNGYGVMLGNSAIFENTKNINATGATSMGVYTENSTA